MTSIRFIVHTPEEFRDALAESGVFDLVDCKMKVKANEFTEVRDLTKITQLLEAAINVTDVEVVTRPYDLSLNYEENGIEIEITSVSTYQSGIRNSGLRPRTPKKPLKDEE